MGHAVREEASSRICDGGEQGRIQRCLGCNVQLSGLLVRQDPVMDHSCDSEGLLRLHASQAIIEHLSSSVFVAYGVREMSCMHSVE